MTRAVGMPAEHVTAMRNAPMWETFEKVAPTLRYNAAIMGDTMRGNPESMKKWASVSVPTLVMDGGASPWYMQHSAEELANLLPQGQHRRLPGQDHGPSDELLIPALVQFLKNEDHIQAGTR
ncbi:alpha/beta fold hydrolase [Thermosporothrix hazakensis]|nr:alpha/beta hydrolase [Thermosporothrix hazakensis]